VIRAAREGAGLLILGSGRCWERGPKAMPRGLDAEQALAWIADIDARHAAAGEPKP